MADKLKVDNLVYFDISSEIESWDSSLKGLEKKGYNLISFRDLIDMNINSRYL